MTLQEEVVIITGASKGIGKAMAKALVEEGATVVCASRTEGTLNEAVADISSKQGKAVGISTDIQSSDSVKNLFETTRKKFGTVDVLINNAATTQRVLTGGEHYPISEIPIDVWDTVIDTNLRGAFLCTKSVLPMMIEKDKGKVIHVSSIGGERARKFRGAYSTSKFGLEALHECLANELENCGVDSLVVRPPQGGANTGMMEVYDEESRKSMYSPDIMSNTIVDLVYGEGENGGRYVPTADGEQYIHWPRKRPEERPSDHPDFKSSNHPEYNS